MFSPVYTSEMRALQSNFPLMFYKNPEENTFQPVALFGFEQGENLFIDDEQWHSQYIPMLVQRGPLMIAVDGQTDTGEPARVVAIDMDHPNVSETDGEPLFLEGIHVGHTTTPQFAEALAQHGLITPITLKITLRNQEDYALEGFYAVDDERLQVLNDSAIADLQRRGHLLPAFMMVASQSQLKRLIDLKNQKVSG